MTRERANGLIRAIVDIRKLATDEQALGAVSLYPEWKSGAVYAVGDRVSKDGTLYRCLTAHTSQDAWVPEYSTALWTKVLIPCVDIIPEWEQPDSTNPYMAGDKVLYGGVVWMSNIDNNVWPPDVYGWNEVVVNG